MTGLLLGRGLIFQGGQGGRGWGGGLFYRTVSVEFDSPFFHHAICSLL